MPITTFPISTVPPTANLIINTPSGSVTATNVQTAINDLAASIPAVGPGTDPLALVNGLTVDAHNPTVSGNITDRYAARVATLTDCSQTNPGFANNAALQVAMNATNGLNTFNGGTDAKQSFYAINIGAVYNAAGQKFLYNNNLTSYGMGDCATWANNYVQFAGGPVSSDEGQGWGLVSDLTQQRDLEVETITSVPAPLTVNTTTTQIIAKSKDAQTVTVVNTTGVVDGGWVVIEQQVPNSGPNLEAVQVISHGANTITGIFTHNHASGVTVTPALRLFVSYAGRMGQDRVLVNLSQPAITAGTVTSISGGAFTGTGTAWSNTMVGGNDVSGNRNIGAISLAADDYTDAPFNSTDRLRSWYQIVGVSSATVLGIFRTSTSSDASYAGRGPIVGSGNPASAYTIRQAARILRVVTDASGGITGELICETSTSTWSIGDTVEEIICPYCDVTGFQYHFSTYTNGGGTRAFMKIVNGGARQAGACFDISDNTFPLPSADPLRWGQIFYCASSCKATLLSLFATEAAIDLNSSLGFGGQTDAGGKIRWDGGLFSITPSSTIKGLEIGTQSTLTLNGRLQFVHEDVAPVPPLKELKWYGNLRIAQPNIDFPPRIVLERIQSGSLGQAFIRFGFDTADLGTEGITTPGSAYDVAIKPNNIERVRFKSTGTGMQLAAGSFAQLPSAPSEGSMAPITDSNTDVWGTNIGGGGGFHVLGYYNGSNWTVMAK